MESKKSIRDIISPNNSNVVSDTVSQKNIIKKTTKVEALLQEDDIEESVVEPIKTKKRFLKLNKIKSIYLIVACLIIVLTTVLFFIPSPYSKDPVEQSKKEAEVVKKEFSKHIIIPENEQVDIRKITSKVEDPFFQKAEIGDYLIIFYENRIAFIYSVDKNIIVNAGVVFIDPKTATTTKEKTN